MIGNYCGGCTVHAASSVVLFLPANDMNDLSQGRLGTVDWGRRLFLRVGRGKMIVCVIICTYNRSPPTMHWSIGTAQCTGYHTQDSDEHNVRSNSVFCFSHALFYCVSWMEPHVSWNDSEIVASKLMCKRSVGFYDGRYSLFSALVAKIPCRKHMMTGNVFATVTTFIPLVRSSMSLRCFFFRSLSYKQHVNSL